MRRLEDYIARRVLDAIAFKGAFLGKSFGLD